MTHIIHLIRPSEKQLLAQLQVQEELVLHLREENEELEDQLSNHRENLKIQKQLVHDLMDRSQWGTMGMNN
jgi:hypothetical protein